MDGKVAQGGSCHRPAVVCGDRHRSADRKGIGTEEQRETIECTLCEHSIVMNKKGNHGLIIL